MHFQIYFQICSPSSFFKNCGYLFCLTCKNSQKNYERAESEETKKNNKNNIQQQKRICKVSFIYAVRKKSKGRTTPLFLSMHKNPILKSQADNCERLLYLWCFHYRTTSQVQKKFQDGNTYTGSEKHPLRNSVIYIYIYIYITEKFTKM